jgi:hypothetical protein
MTRTKLFFIAIACFMAVSCSKPTPVATNYTEADDPNPANPEEWASVPKGLSASFASPFVRFPKSGVPQLEAVQETNLTAWKAERVYSQVILWSPDSIENVELRISDFESNTGDKFPGANAKVNVVRYVLTDEFGKGCNFRKSEDYPASLSPDVLDTVSSFSISPGTSRPVWISIDVPKNAESGLYRASVEVKAKKQSAKTFQINVEVLDQTLPPPTDWEFSLDLWQNPFSVARYHGVELWSQAHFDALKPVMKMLADAGQKAITVSLNKLPWGGQTQDPYESMIVWTKLENGEWEYDFTIFDQWVQFMMDLGVKEMISCYSLVPWGNEFYYFDQESNSEIKTELVPGTPEYRAFLTPFLMNFRKHLEEKGWNEITVLAMDERAPEEMAEMIKFVKEIAPEFGISLADSHNGFEAYSAQLKDVSLALGRSVITDEDLAYRKSHGLNTSYYVCCVDSFPNVFTFSEPAEAVYIPWLAQAHNLDGFLRWAYNHWVTDPLIDSRFRRWPAGDTYIVYPGARSSVRFEMLRDGIEDAEKIRVLRRQFTGQDQTEKLERLNELVAKFKSITRPDGLNTMVHEAQNTLNGLSKQQ